MLTSWGRWQPHADGWRRARICRKLIGGTGASCGSRWWSWARTTWRRFPYYLHLYYFPHGLPPSTRGVALLGLTLAWFAAGWVGLARGHMAGYWLLFTFLLTEVSFYAHGILNRVVNGYPAFQEMHTHDALLLAVFAIGYVNMLFGLYFLAYLLRHRHALTASAVGVWRSQ